MNLRPAVDGAVVVGAATGWPVGAVLAALSGWGPGLLTSTEGRSQLVARVEAIDGWAEMPRDTLAGAAGVEQATATVGPPPIRGDVATIAVRLEGERLAPSLRGFADDVAGLTYDLVVAALVLATEHQAQRLGELLGSLAAAALPCVGFGPRSVIHFRRQQPVRGQIRGDVATSPELP